MRGPAAAAPGLADAASGAQRASEPDAALPQITPWLHRGFMRYLRVYLRRHLNALRLSHAGGFPEHEGPLLVYSNHPSWWDPLLFAAVVESRAPGRPLYGPMDAEALRKYKIFSRLGVFGVEMEGRRGAAQFLRAGLAILEQPRSVLWVTAEGEIRDPRSRPLRLRPGVAHLARRVEGAAVVPAAVEMAFWDERLPEAMVRFGEPMASGPVESVEGWQRRLETRLEETLDALASEVTARDPRAFDSLLSGRSGVGGVYDLWRRLRARLAGRAFDPSHGGREQERR